MPEEYKEYLEANDDGTIDLLVEKWSMIEDDELRADILDYAFENGKCILKF